MKAISNSHCVIVAFGLIFGMPTATIAEAASESVLYNFLERGNSGGQPIGTVIRVGGDLYGTTDYSGKAGGAGTVYRVTGSGNYKLLYNFTSPIPGDSVYPRTLINAAGTVYGTTTYGGGTGCGGYGCGVIYSLTPSGVYNVIYAFQGLSDGSSPGLLIYVNGVFYGVAQGGSSSCQCGTVFSLTPQGVLTTLYDFQGGLDGSFPNSLIDVGGVLYGTAENGGGTVCNGGYGCGAIFSITLQGRESILYRFATENDGDDPNSSLLSLGGALYGTTFSGGKFHGGTVFRVTLTGHHTTLHEFSISPTDAYRPVGGLTTIGATLYGTTAAGGSGGDGVVFSITTHGEESILHAFDGLDGKAPLSTMISSHGVLYGTTSSGGTGGKIPGGVLFEIMP